MQQPLRELLIDFILQFQLVLRSYFYLAFCFEERTICRATESKTNVELSLISNRSKICNFVGDTVHWFLWQSICTIRPNLVSTVSRDLAFMQPQVWQMWCIKVHIHDEWVFIVIVCRSCERSKMNIQYILPFESFNWFIWYRWIFLSNV